MLDRFFQSPLIKVSLRYGAIAGFLCSVTVISMYYMGKHPFLVNPFFDFRVPAFSLLLFFSLKEIRDYFREGVLTFFQGLGGSFIFLIAAILVSDIILYIFGSFQPDFVNEYICQLMVQIRNIPPESVDQAGKAAIENSLKEIPLVTMAYLTGLYAWQSVQIGFFISVIISVILRRQPVLIEINPK